MNEIIFNEIIENLKQDILNNKAFILSYLDTQLNIINSKISALGMFAGLSVDQISDVLNENFDFSLDDIMIPDEEKIDTGEYDE